MLLLYSQGIFVLLLLLVKSRFFHWPWPMTFHWGVFELGGATFNFPPTTSHATPIKILTFFQKSWRTLKDGQCCVDCGYTSHLRVKKIFRNILIPDFLRKADPPNGHPDLTRNLVTTTATPLHLNDYPLVSLLALKAPLVLVLSLGIEKLGGTVNTPWWWVDNELHFEQVKLPQKWGEDFFFPPPPSLISSSLLD